MSEPSAQGASPPATAAAEPPEDPPGTRSGSQGFFVGPYAEFSVDEPIANSSMLVLPTIGRPASLHREATVESKTGMYPCRILEPAVVGIPFVVMTSLCAIGTPVPVSPTTWRNA